MINYTITNDNLHLVDSYTVPTRRYDKVLNSIEALHPNSDVWRRSRWSMKAEWVTHSALYDLHLFRSHTKDVDINYPQCWLATAAYSVIAVLVWPFIN